MLTFRPTKKAREAWGIKDADLSTESGAPFEDWFVDVAMLPRKRHFLFINRTTLYGFWAPVPRAELAGLADLFALHLAATMKADGFSEEEARSICQPEFRFGKPNDRSVTGSMMDHVKNSRWYFDPASSASKDVASVSHRLNHTPMGALGPGSDMGFPVDALREHLRGR